MTEFESLSLEVSSCGIHDGQRRSPNGSQSGINLGTESLDVRDHQLSMTPHPL